MKVNSYIIKNNLFIIFVLLSFVVNAQNENNSTVSGKVLYSRNGKPCIKKIIELSDTNPKGIYCKSAVTDSSGHYFYKNIPPSVYLIKCFESLDNVFTDTITVTAGNEVVHNFSVTRKYSTFPPVIFNLGIHQGWRTMGEISVGTCDEWKHMDLIGYRWFYTTIGSEFNFNPHHFIAGPKISFNHENGALVVGFDWGGSLIYYTDFDKGALYLNPHLGLNFMTLAGLYFGYNIPLYSSSGDNPMHSLVNHFTVSIIFSLVNHDKLMKL